MYTRSFAIERRSSIPVLAATAAVLLLAWPTPGTADVLEDDAVSAVTTEASDPAASATEQAILGAMDSPQARGKAIAIVGLFGPEADERLAEIQLRMTSASS